jgi:hypothetical protein
MEENERPTNATVEMSVEARDALEIYPTVPSPLTVETNELLNKEVLTRFKRFGVETKLKRFAVET